MTDYDLIKKAGYDLATLEKKMTVAKIKLFQKKGKTFLASIMSQTQFIIDTSIPTAQTDGISIRWNPLFFAPLEIESWTTVLAHELWHIGFAHPIIRGDRNPKKWNIACDHVINLMLQDSGFTFVGIENCYKDRQYANMSTFDVYNALPDEPNGGDDGSEDGSGSPKNWGGDDLQDAPSQEQPRVAAKVIQAQKAAKDANEAGSVPGEIALSLHSFLNPILPWERLLHKFFTERANNDYSRIRPNRRYEDIYMSSLVSDDALTKITFYQDISGSVTDEQILRMNSEVRFIHSEFSPEVLKIVTFDTGIRDEYTFTDNDSFDGITVHGRGGTDLNAVYKHIKKEKPSVAVIFTDLYCNPMKDPNIPILWVIVDNPTATTEFGEVIHIKDE